MRTKMLVVLGPTATGKTDLAIRLAKKNNGELIACDSRQVYVGLDIGTGKLPCGRWKIEGERWKKDKGHWEIDGVKIWMYDIVDPKTQYSVADYVQDAAMVIEDVLSRKKLPIIVGGTGFYLKALLEGLPNLAVPIDQGLREELGRLSKQQLQDKLQQLSPTWWQRMNHSDKQNPRRLLRSIELILMNPYVEHKRKISTEIKNWDVLKIGLNAPRQVLYTKINSRVLDWISDGILDEVKKLKKKGIKTERFKTLGLEYAVLADYLDKKISQKELIEKMQIAVRRYVKRQITWFRNPSTSSGYINWFDINNLNWIEQVEKLVVSWYNQGE